MALAARVPPHRSTCRRETARDWSCAWSMSRVLSPLDEVFVSERNRDRTRRDFGGTLLTNGLAAVSLSRNHGWAGCVLSAARWERQSTTRQQSSIDSICSVHTEHAAIMQPGQLFARLMPDCCAGQHMRGGIASARSLASASCREWRGIVGAAMADRRVAGRVGASGQMKSAGKRPSTNECVTRDKRQPRHAVAWRKPPARPARYYQRTSTSRRRPDHTGIARARSPASRRSIVSRENPTLVTLYARCQEAARGRVGRTGSRSGCGLRAARWPGAGAAPVWCAPAVETAG
jgi:hypothetical protein